MEKEFNLTKEMEEAFSSVKKISFLKNKREQEVFKLALQTAFAYQRKFIKVINNKMKHLGYREDVEMARAIINEIAGDKLCWNYNIQT